MYERNRVYFRAMYELGYINGVTILVTGNLDRGLFEPRGSHMFCIYTNFAHVSKSIVYQVSHGKSKTKVTLQEIGN